MAMPTMWGALVHRHVAQMPRPTGRSKSTCVFACAVALSCFSCTCAHAIDVHLTAGQVQAALAQGKEAAEKRRSPDSFYVRFGVTDAVQPKGFLITKTGALSIMATHMALRGLEPSQADVAQVLEGKTMLVNIVIFGNTLNFAVDSYMVLNQGTRTIKPVTVRFDAQADRSVVWPKSPGFKAKVVASFDYADFDPRAETTITVYPGIGDSSSFSMYFNEIR